MKSLNDKCLNSESGNHSFFPENHSRDDLGFYCVCVNCKELIFFNDDTLSDFYSNFEGYDDDE